MPKPSTLSVALQFGIAETTLRRAVSKGIGSLGRPTILSDYEERELAGYALNMQQLGFGLTKAAMNTKIMEIVQFNPRQYTFRGNQPSREWWEGFMSRHRELSFRVPQELTAARAQRANPVIVQDHFRKLGDLVEKHGLSAGTIWNMDETGFSSSGAQKVIAKRGVRQVHRRAKNGHDHISVCATICANGSFIPPLIIYKGKRVPAGILDGAPAGTVCAFTETGYMHQNIFRQYIQHFIKSISIARPVMLMLDGASSHIDLTSIELCRENDILLYALPPNTTHILQPAEIPFKKLKSEYAKASDTFLNNGEGGVVTKISFAKVFGEAFLTTYTPLAITNAFKATGVWPLNPDAISVDRLAPSLVTRIPTPKKKPPTPRRHKHDTRAAEIVRLRRLVKELKEENERLKNPGSTSLAQILRYPLQQKTTNQQDNKKPSKAIPFSRLLTQDEIHSELKAKEAAVARKLQEIQQKKEIRKQKKAAKEMEKAEREKKRQLRSKKG